MPNKSLSLLTNRSLLRLTGAEVRSFLQNLITNDLDELTPEHPVYAALLTPQGKFLHDFIILDWQGALYLDCLTERSADLVRRLTMYKLRADVTIEDVSDEFDVFALYGDVIDASQNTDEVLIYPDPRQEQLGFRIIAKTGSNFADAHKDLTPSDLSSYTKFRLSLGIPEGGTDITPEKNFLLEVNFEELHGVSFSKGCYVGQELTARTKHRAKIKKRLFRFTYDGEISPGDPITCGDSEIAVVSAFEAPYGLALTRISEWQKTADSNAVLSPAGLVLTKPDYVNLPENED